tara:strand:+ start:338 stop:502 length:165 start_codon:yes stop_codon:yes gene_type:complete
MQNRYHVKIRLYDDLPDMPQHGKYLEFMIEANSEEEIRMAISTKHKITMITQVD